jgi:hypothetical protein
MVSAEMKTTTQNPEAERYKAVSQLERKRQREKTERETR